MILRSTFRHVRWPMVHYARKTPRYSSSKILTTCSSCSTPLPTPLPLCPACKHIDTENTSLHDRTHHAIFDLPYEPNPFEVDSAAIKRKYHEYMKICHPDVWQSAEQSDQKLAQAISERVNNAFSVLINPLPRVEYILEQNGMQLDEMDIEEDSAGFFSEAWEAREEIDDASTAEDIYDIQEANNVKIDALCASISQDVKVKNWSDVKTHATQLKYMIGIHNAARARLHELG